MELRHLRYFRVVAEEGHITRAAERLSIQQPPLSLQIKALEKEMGVQLFNRRPRGVELTAAGRAFYSDVTSLLSELDDAILRAQKVQRGEQGDIAIGFTSSVIFHPATKSAIQSFRTAFPLVAVRLEEDGSSELVMNIAHNRLDAAFIRTDRIAEEGIRIIPLLDEPVYLAVPLDHPFAKAPDRPIDLADVLNEPLVLYRRSSGPGLYDRIASAFGRLGAAPQIIQEAPRVGSALNLVAAGLGISFVPQSLSPSHREGVIYRPIKADPPLVAPIILACRKSESSEAVKAFVETVRGTMKE